jgi:broad specificity phosphatase PhoE
MGVLNPVAFLYLRHGETDWNAAGLSQGNVDIQLNATGIAQARAAAQLLRNRGIRTIVSSPLSRARDTALAASEVLGLPVAYDDGLREVAFGRQEGQPMVEWFDEWVAERYTPEDAESFSVLRTRAVAAINRATANDPLVLVVAHGALFRAIRSAAGLVANVRTVNGQPLLLEPPRPGTPGWRLTPLAPETSPA